MKFSILKNKKLPQEAQKSLLPRKEFLTQGKERFLAAFDASPLAAAGRTAPGLSGWTVFFRVGIGALAAIAVAAGVSAYADTANVSPTSPLYPVKRFAENVQLAVTPANGQAQLQATFAVQRANEIDALQVENPTSTLIPQLTGQLDAEISSSIVEATEATSSASGSVNVFCGAFDKSTSSVLFGHLESVLVLHPNILQNFNQQCGTDSHRRGQISDYEGVLPTSTIGHGVNGGIIATTTVNTTTVLPAATIGASTTIAQPTSTSYGYGAQGNANEGAGNTSGTSGVHVSAFGSASVKTRIPGLGGIL